MRNAILTFLGLLITPVCFAQPGAGGPPQAGAGGMPDNETIFANNDANGDGVITQAEAEAAGLPLGQNWAAFDLDSDGKVTAEELDTMRGRMGGAGGAGRAGGGAGRAGGPGARSGGPGARAGGAGGDQSEGEDDDD